MSISRIGDEGVHNGGRESFANVGFTTGRILPYLDIVFAGLQILLRVRINYYECGFFFPCADLFLRVPILI